MKHFFLIANTRKDPAFALTDRIASYIIERGGTCDYLKKDGVSEGFQEALSAAIPPATECILVIGGDGTLIKASRETFGRQIPLIGVNLGTLGYLCELEEETLFPAIDRMLTGDVMIEERMMLTGTVERDGQVIQEETALNDIVIHRTGALHVISYEVTVNGQLLSSYRADGIIVSTPTGSTAYNLSAGGPIVDPKAAMLLLTPINSHDLNNKSIVFDGQAEIVLQMGGGESNAETDVEISFDGTNALRLFPRDIIRIRRAAQNTRILKLNKKSFLEILQRKMQTYR